MDPWNEFRRRMLAGGVGALAGAWMAAARGGMVAAASQAPSLQPTDALRRCAAAIHDPRHADSVAFAAAFRRAGLPVWSVEDDLVRLWAGPVGHALERGGAIAGLTRYSDLHLSAGCARERVASRIIAEHRQPPLYAWIVAVDSR